MMKKLGIFVLLAALVLCQGVSAHMPGAAAPAPEVDLGPIVVSDNGVPVEISIDDVGKYHGMLEGKSPDVCVCCACTYRAILSGINEVWGDEIPERSDIGLKCGLISNGSVHAAWYVTGTDMDPNNQGKLELILPDGSVLTNQSPSAIKKASKARTPESYWFEVSRLSTGDSVKLTVSDDVFPEGFAEMRKKVKFDKTASKDEIRQFISDYTSVRDGMLQKADYELFNEIEEPDESPDILGGGIFLTLLCGLCIGLVVMRRK
ncbi:hypothetical protein [Methanogenium sp. MK-MG]|uniref:hypothetical protein n=1 Tax=Methanogenium sp. MK-MG TaxID=2599926 RepID=UPI0020B15CC5|nr:hypothetical protein [Methanogenium sp. MK-MG]KAF1076396.1 hypothetical protein MKMG_01532 [Methanogenium sp. MK-MG]